MSLLEEAAEIAAPEAALPAKVGAWLFNDLWRLGCIVALIGVAVQEVRIDGLWFVEGWRPRALKAEKGLADIKAAQPKAVAAQAAVNHQPAVISATIAKASDDEAASYYAKGRAAGVAYALAHPAGVLCPAAPQSDAGHADLPRADHAAQLDDRPGDPAVGVAVPRPEYDQLIANNLRLAKVHQDAEALIASGVAVAADKPD